MTDDEAGRSQSISEILARCEREGFGTQMGTRPDGQIICFACRSTTDADNVRLRALHRTEGASDPSEMAAVAAVESPVCGAHGTVVLGYGPGASIDDNDVLTGLTDARNA